MRFVLDASIVATWALRDEDHPIADLAFREIRTGSAIAPELLWYEMRNILVSNELRKRILPEDSLRFLSLLDQLSLSMDARPESSFVMSMSRKYNLSAYDATYLSLAARERLPLATLDVALQNAATAEGVALLG